MTGYFFTLDWFPWSEPSMYTPQTGLGFLNPFNVLPLYSTFRFCGGSREWWDIVFQPHYTASFLTDYMYNLVGTAGPLIEMNIPLNPTPTNATQCDAHSGAPRITTCETWADAGNGMNEAFTRMTQGVDVKVNTRVADVAKTDHNTWLVRDEYGKFTEVDRVIFACPCNAVGNMRKNYTWVEEALLGSPEYADDWHPGEGHMHALMHSDASVLDPVHRYDVLHHGSNYVEVTQTNVGSPGEPTYNIENQYNFGVQTVKMFHRDVDKKPPMLISHALGEGKSIDPALVRGTGNHVRAHPLFSSMNVVTMLMLRFAQSREGVYYCSNWTTPGNCHDMSLVSGFSCAAAIGARYPFEGQPDLKEARKDFWRLRSIMGI